MRTLPNRYHALADAIDETVDQATPDRLQPALKYKGTFANDTLTGTDADDVFRGYEGHDSLIGNGGTDWMSAGDGDDICRAGAGNDSVKGGAGNDTLYGDTGDDSLYGGEGSDALYGSDGDTILEGGAGDDWLFERLGNNQVYGGGGDDFVKFSSEVPTGTNRIDGGSGRDILSVDWSAYAGAVVWTNDPDQAVTVHGWTVSSFETLYLELGTGSDVIAGSNGDDLLLGHDGDDQLNGGAGNDQLFGEGDTWPDIDNDLLLGGDGNDVLYGFTGSDTLNGGSGHDSIYFGANIVTAQGGDGDDTFGNSNWDVGSGTLNGGKGLDTLKVNWAGHAGTLNLTNDPNLTQQAYGYTIKGFERLSIAAGSGNDTLLGGIGDWFSGGSGNDSLTGASLSGGPGNDTMTGTDIGDHLEDYLGDDVYDGGGGADTLKADAGRDTLTGGADADRFQFWSTGEATVTDFLSGTDTIWLYPTPVYFDREEVKGPDRFSASSKIVLVWDDIHGAITADSAAAAIGSALSSYTASSVCKFIVDNGTDTAIFHFDSAGADALVSAAELTLIATLKGTGQTQLPDFY